MEREARTSRLARGDEPCGWNWLCVSRQTSREAIVFLLLLYLLQEQVIKLTDEVAVREELSSSLR